MTPQVSYCSVPGFPKRGTYLKTVSIEDLLSYSNTLSPKSPKHTDGSFFVYQSNRSGRYDPNSNIPVEENKTLKSNIGVIDIDDLSYEEVDNIYNNFNILSEKLPNLIAVQKSSGYYVSSNHRSGIHIFVALPLCNTEEDWNYEYGVAAAAFLFGYEKLFGETLKIDESLKSVWHQVFIHYGDYQINNYYAPIKIKAEQVAFLKKNYSCCFKKEITIFSDPESSRNWHINNTWAGDRVRLGHTQRWQVTRAIRSLGYTFDAGFELFNKLVLNYHKEGTKYSDAEWLSEFKANWEARTSYNTIGLEFLRSRGVISECSLPSGGCVLGEGQYCLDKIEEIIKYSENKSRFCIVAPTGTGKTTLINGLGDPDYKDGLFSGTYTEGLASRLNAIVLNPYNINNNLYNNLYEVSTVKGNTKEEIPSGKPVTLVYDQAARLWNQISDRWIIIDESHILFSDCGFRPALYKLIKLIQGTPRAKVITVTATPSGEIDLLGIKDYFTIVKPKQIINTTVVNCEKNCSTELWKQISIGYKRYDKVFVATDCWNKSTYGRAIASWGEQEVALIRASEKGSTDFEALRAEERLTKKVTIATRLAYNGLNFNNSGRILVISVFFPGITDIAAVLQTVGRLRKANTDLVVIVGKKDALSAEERRQLAEAIRDNWTHCELSDSEVEILEDDIFAAQALIEEYEKENSTVDNLKNTLLKAGYFRVSETTDDQESGIADPIKRKVSDLFVENLESDTVEYRVGDRYEDKLYNQLYLKYTEARKNTRKEEILKIYNLKKERGGVLLWTVLAELLAAEKVLSLSDTEWEEYKTGYKKTEDRIKQIGAKSEALDKILKALKARYSKAARIRKTYYSETASAEKIYDTFLDDYIKGEATTGLNIKVKKVEGGKIGGKIGGKKSSPKKGIIDNTGKEYTSIETICKAKNISSYQVHQRLKAGTYKWN